MTNPLDSLQQFDPASLSRRHTSGRRELREQFLARGVTLRVRPATLEDRMKMARGEKVDSLPIRRAVPKVKGKKRNKKKARGKSGKEPT